MKTVISKIVAPRKAEFFEEDIPSMGSRDMIIKMDAVGLCHSDIPAYIGNSVIQIHKYGFREPIMPKYPVAVGHEAIGTVVDVGSEVKRFKVGDKVSGRVRQCFCTYMHIPDCDSFAPTIQLFVLPRMDKNYLCCLAEPLEDIVNIARFANPEFGQNVAVVGCGAMGLLTVCALRHTAAKRIVAVDMLDNKLELAKEFGATHVLNPRNIENMSETAYLLTEGMFFDVVVEITGSIRGLDTAMQMIKYTHKDGHAVNQYMGSGRIMLSSVYTREEVFPARLGFNMVVRTPIMYNLHPTLSIDPMSNELEGIAAFVDGRLPMEKLITHRFPFAEMSQALEHLVEAPNDYIKGIVTFD
ncbi:MAG: alcohol dehydrogenase catalytic domain-containing protein [Peptococcaceae bacterium]|jgi:threonine dehydrogenase-like Zn-dependent dehydrogenase|nr:alcohol dehydrogenase catalytic domain-containing protein [Peptococcaceae bacterium]